MKIRRYFAADMRTAIRMVREEQGPDAVILSNRQVEGGIEVVAALDYDEAMVARLAAEERQTTPAVTRRAPQVAAIKQPLPEESPASEQTAPSQPSQPAAARPTSQSISWSQDPSLVAMREEIKTLRGMLEGQLSGLAWGDMQRRHPLYTNIFERLIRLGLSGELARQVIDSVTLGEDEEQNWLQVLTRLASEVAITDDDILSHGGVVSLVGPTGVGKTTTVAKLAARYTLRHGPGRVALVTTDSFRIGAYQQLRTYGRILNAPVYVVKDAEELQQTLDTLSDTPLVLIDTAGMSQRDMRLNRQTSLFDNPSLSIRHYVVLSATTQRLALEEVVEAFSHLQPSGCILTKLDESAVPGEALGTVIQRQLPVAYIGDGQRVPEDLKPARANNLVNRCVTTTQQRQAVEQDEDELALMFGHRVRREG